VIFLALPLIVMIAVKPERPIRLRKKLDQFERFRRDERTVV